MAENPSGLFVVDKPAGCTSHDVVDRVRKSLGTKKAGHSGTLDPPATGVLLIGVGKATRLLAFLQNLPKTYRAVAQFGVSTSTQDAEGEVIASAECSVTREQLEQQAVRFRGEIHQIPPMVSAVKIGGEPLYRAARRGETVDRPARSVRIYEFRIEDFDESRQSAGLFVKCSSGTYVRTLASDLGDALGCGAHLTSLRRTAVGSFDQSEAISLDQLESQGRGAAGAMIPMRQAMRDFPEVEVEGERLKTVVHGGYLTNADGDPAAPAPAIQPRRPGELTVLSASRPGDRPAHEAGMTAGLPVGIIDPQGRLIAVYRKAARGLKPAAVLV